MAAGILQEAPSRPFVVFMQFPCCCSLARPPAPLVVGHIDSGKFINVRRTGMRRGLQAGRQVLFQLRRSLQPLPRSSTAFGNPSLYFWTPLLNGLHAQHPKGCGAKGVGMGRFGGGHCSGRVSYCSTTLRAGCRTMRVMK